MPPRQSIHPAQIYKEWLESTLAHLESDETPAPKAEAAARLKISVDQVEAGSNSLFIWNALVQPLSDGIFAFTLTWTTRLPADTSVSLLDSNGAVIATVDTVNLDPNRGTPDATAIQARLILLSTTSERPQEWPQPAPPGFYGIAVGDKMPDIKWVVISDHKGRSAFAEIRHGDFIRRAQE